jgi:hypothetical protein
MPQVKPIVEVNPDDLDLSPANWDNNGGWGLPLIQAIASEYGVRKTEPHGKWAWARLAITQQYTIEECCH